MKKNADEWLEGLESCENVLALFDFDGTLTRKDTLAEMIRFMYGGWRYYRGLAVLSPQLLLYKLKLIPNQDAKEKVLSYFFKDVNHQEFQEQCRQFAAKVLPALLRPKAMDVLLHLKAAGSRIVIVSASPEDWVGPFAISIGVEYLATSLEVREGRLTGKIDGVNCHGKEKVNRIRSAVDLLKYDRIYAFGDSAGDRQMLSLATHPFYKAF
jgi:HAD superfamily hydrolase (TIGR01490 family)